MYIKEEEDTNIKKCPIFPPIDQVTLDTTDTKRFIPQISSIVTVTVTEITEITEIAEIALIRTQTHI